MRAKGFNIFYFLADGAYFDINVCVYLRNKNLYIIIHYNLTQSIAVKYICIWLLKDHD